jgi:DNA-binding LacI/PurR family transcriptional regulator
MNRVKTIADLARLAAVSKSTVSRALSDSPLIGRETKERIRALAAAHDFRLNIPARRLSLRRSNTIGFVSPACYEDSPVADPFTLEILGSVSNALHSRGYDLLMAHINPRDREWPKEYLISGRVDGFIVLTSSRKERDIAPLVEAEAPFIMWGVPSPRSRYCTVTGDNARGGRLATERLVATGRRRIAFLGGPAAELEVQGRQAGYEETLREAGLPVDPALIVYGDYSFASGAQLTPTLLRQAPDLDAIFAASDPMAMAAINCLRELGRRVPQDVAVIGYDNLSMAAQSSPPLTTVSQNLRLAGRLLAENLLQYLETGVVTHVCVPVELVERESA